MSVITITEENFEEQVAVSAVPVLVDFWAPWCGPCRMVSPVVDEIAEEAEGFAVGKINVDEQPGLAARFGVMSIPTLMVFQNGKPAATAVGVRPKEEILELIAGV